MHSPRRASWAPPAGPPPIAARHPDWHGRRHRETPRRGVQARWLMRPAASRSACRWTTPPRSRPGCAGRRHRPALSRPDQGWRRARLPLAGTAGCGGPRHPTRWRRGRRARPGPGRRCAHQSLSRLQNATGSVERASSVYEALYRNALSTGVAVSEASTPSSASRSPRARSAPPPTRWFASSPGFSASPSSPAPPHRRDLLGHARSSPRRWPPVCCRTTSCAPSSRPCRCWPRGWLRNSASRSARTAQAWLRGQAHRRTGVPRAAARDQTPRRRARPRTALARSCLRATDRGDREFSGPARPGHRPVQRLARALSAAARAVDGVRQGAGMLSEEERFAGMRRQAEALAAQITRLESQQDKPRQPHRPVRRGNIRPDLVGTAEQQAGVNRAARLELRRLYTELQAEIARGEQAAGERRAASRRAPRPPPPMPAGAARPGTSRSSPATSMTASGSTGNMRSASAACARLRRQVASPRPSAPGSRPWRSRSATRRCVASNPASPPSAAPAPRVRRTAVAAGFNAAPRPWKRRCRKPARPQWPSASLRRPGQAFIRSRRCFLDVLHRTPPPLSAAVAAFSLLSPRWRFARSP